VWLALILAGLLVVLPVLAESAVIREIPLALVQLTGVG
jgi:hypothetical protein